MAKNNYKGGESLPLARTSSLATPSPRGKAPKTPESSREFCETKLDSERKRTNNAPVESTIEAPYELPEGWKWERLGNICDLLNGFAFKSTDYVESSNVMNFRMSQIRPGGFTDLYHNTKYLPDSYAEQYKEFLLKDGDIVIAMTDMANDTKILGVPSIVYTDGYKLLLNQRVGKLFNISKTIDSKFLNYMMVSPYTYNYYKSLGKGGLQLNLGKSDILNAIIPLPPTLAEQQRIVNRIETMFAKLDQAQEKVQSVLDSFETRKAAILHKAFTGQLKIDNGELSIEDWEEKSFSDLGTSNLGKMLDANKNTGDEIRYLRNINVRWFDFDLSDLLTMRAKPEEIKKLSVKKGDLFICEGGEPGRCAVWKDENSDLIFQKAIHRFRPNDGVSSEFVAYVLYYYNQIGKLSDYFTGTTIKHLTGQSLAKIPIRIPPLNYQLSIVNFLDTVLEKENRAKEAAQTVLDQIALLKKSILARAFRGKI